MRELAAIEPIFGEPEAGRPIESGNPYAGWMRATEDSQRQQSEVQEAVILVGPGRVLMVLLGWHLLLGLAFTAGWMLG